ncbi:hypothetical protein ACFY0R_10190 [Streptomyces sp. NPDC001633]|uniref:hypothetical protein n=1 Tax=Streptomyces sp. NPDC001633 TaxID=3364595 RepID=UPI0036B559E2
MRTDRYNWELARGSIHAFDESKSLASWAEDPRCMVKREALRTRLALGWHPEDAITRARHEKPPLEYTYNGRTLTLRGWSDQTGINYHTFYNRIHKSGLTFEEALAKGPEGAHFAMPVTASGETKNLHRRAVGPRANCSAGTLRRRLTEGWEPEQAITEVPENRNALGSGVPYHAYGLRMGIEDWARHAQIPAGSIRQRMEQHALSLESALQSLGWTPNSAQGDEGELLQVSADQLRPDDRVLAAVTDAHGTSSLFTVRRPGHRPSPANASSPPSRRRQNNTATSPRATPPRAPSGGVRPAQRHS